MKAWVLVLAILWPEFAAAEFTAEEKAELVELNTVGKNVRAVIVEAGVVGTSSTDAAARAAISASGKNLTEASWAAMKAQGWLLGLRVGATPAESDSCLASPAARAGCWQERLNRVAFMLDQAEARLGAYPTLLTKLQAARAALVGFDSTLPYAEPFPLNAPRQFGPHGEYAEAQATLYADLIYTNEALTQAFDEFALGANPGPNHFMLTTRLFVLAHDAMQRSQLLGARSGANASDIALSEVDRAFLANALLNKPLTGAAHNLHFANVYARKWFTRAESLGLTDGWRNHDAWNYWFFNGGIGVSRGF